MMSSSVARLQGADVMRPVQLHPNRPPGGGVAVRSHGSGMHQRCYRCHLCTAGRPTRAPEMLYAPVRPSRRSSCACSAASRSSSANQAIRVALSPARSQAARFSVPCGRDQACSQWVGVPAQQPPTARGREGRGQGRHARRPSEAEGRGRRAQPAHSAGHRQRACSRISCQVARPQACTPRSALLSSPNSSGTAL